MKRIVMTLKVDVTAFFPADWEKMGNQEIKEWIQDLPEAVAFQDPFTELVFTKGGDMIHKVEKIERTEE